MTNLREEANLFYYNIFRFECFIKYLLGRPIYGLMRISGFGKIITRLTGRENWKEYAYDVLNNPKDGISLHFAGTTAHQRQEAVHPFITRGQPRLRKSKTRNWTKALEK